MQEEDKIKQNRTQLQILWQRNTGGVIIVNIVNCYNKNNDYYIDFRQLLEEDEFAYYDEKLRDKDITFTDMAKEPSSVNEIISRTVHNYVINPDDLKYLILDKTVILDATSDNLIRLKNAIKEYAVHFKNMIIMEQGGDPVGELKREAGNGRNFYLFTESDRNKLIKEVLDKLIELEENPDGKVKRQTKINIPKLKDRQENTENTEKPEEVKNDIYNISSVETETEETETEEIAIPYGYNQAEEDNNMEESYLETADYITNGKSIHKEPKTKFTEKLVSGLKGKSGKEEAEKKNKKEKKKEDVKPEIDKGINIKFPKAYIKPEGIDSMQQQETRINRQEEVTVKEMLRYGVASNSAAKPISYTVKNELQVNRFTEERLSQAVKMEHLLEKSKAWHSIDNVIIMRGLYGNISATYLSLTIANILQNNNASVAYINDSHNDFLYTIQNYGLKKTGKFYVRDNIVFMENFMAIPDVNFYIIDSKEAYYGKQETLLANGFTPFYFVLANGDAKGISFLKNEQGMLKANGIDNYRLIVKDINAEMYNVLYKELNANKVIEYRHIDDEPFGSLAKNSSIANEVYRLLDEIDENIGIKEQERTEEQEIPEEENEI